MPGSLEGPHVTLQSDVHKKPFKDMSGFFMNARAFSPPHSLKDISDLPLYGLHSSSATDCSKASSIPGSSSTASRRR